MALKTKIKTPKVEPKFLSHNDVQMRLDGGIVLYEEMPHLAMFLSLDDAPETSVGLYAIGEYQEKPIIVDANDPKVFTKTLDMGYVNQKKLMSYNTSDGKPIFRNHAGFVFRGTNRKQKSVIHPTNTYVIWCGSTVPQTCGSGLFNTGDFRDMLLNEYPTTRDFSFLEKGESLAVSRNFAILGFAKEHRLYFNGHEIGTRKHGDTFFNLEPGYDHSIMVMRLASLDIPV